MFSPENHVCSQKTGKGISLEKASMQEKKQPNPAAFFIYTRTLGTEIETEIRKKS